MSGPVPPPVPKMPFNIQMSSLMSLAPGEMPQSLQDRVAHGRNFLLTIPETICLNFYLPMIEAYFRSVKGRDQQNFVTLGLSEDIQGKFKIELEQFDFSKRLPAEARHLPTLVKSIWEKVQTANPDPQMRDLVLRLQSEYGQLGYLFSEGQSRYLLQTVNRANETLVNNLQKGMSSTPAIKGADGFSTIGLVNPAESSFTDILYPILDMLIQSIANDEFKARAFKKHSPAGWAVFNTTRPQFLSALLEVKDAEIIKKLLEIVKQNNFLVSVTEEKNRRFLTILFVKEMLRSQPGLQSIKQLASKAAQAIRMAF